MTQTQPPDDEEPEYRDDGDEWRTEDESVTEGVDYDDESSSDDAG